MMSARRPLPHPAWIWLTGIAFSGLIEFLQYALPINRSAEWGDVAANVVGVTAATCIIMLLRRFR
jgi:VanZ family protein